FVPTLTVPPSAPAGGGTSGAGKRSVLRCDTGAVRAAKGAAMTGWNAMSYEGRDTILPVVKREAESMFALAERPDLWDTPTACVGWEVRDVIGHMVDVTEAYFVSFDAARGGPEAPAAYGVRGMAARVNELAQAFR